VNGPNVKIFAGNLRFSCSWNMKGSRYKSDTGNTDGHHEENNVFI